MTIDQIIETTSNKPIDESVPLVAKALKNNEMHIPISAEATDSHMQFLTGKDNEGNVWLYIYSDKKHFNEHIKKEARSVIVSLKELDNIMRTNAFFRGIYVNASYPIPREVFGLLFSE